MNSTVYTSRFHQLYQTRYSDWDELEKAIARLPTAKEQGDAFEQFCLFYFQYYAELYEIEEVWCGAVKGKAIPNEIREKYQLQRTDFGTDGINQLKGGAIEAWQAKFRFNRNSPTYRELATFWADAEHADFRRVISNSRALPRQTAQRGGHRQTLVDSFLNVDGSFFDALHVYATEGIDNVTREKYSPLPHQERMIGDVIAGFQEHDRGKLVAACGTGKTLAAMWVAEHETLGASRVLVLVPSLALLGQTLRVWTSHSRQPFSYIAVCSDNTVESQAAEQEDSFDIAPSELGITVTTSAKDVKSWLTATAGARQYIFSTYHSSNVVEEAIHQINGYRFDLIIADEAHRTVGSSNQLFGLCLKDEHLPARKRLFMTATERLLSPAIQTWAAKSGREVFSMENQSVYGPVLHSYSFGKAIKEKVIADYEIVLVEVTDPSQQELIEANRILEIESTDPQEATYVLGAEELLKAGFLVKAFENKLVSKTVTFHNLQRKAKGFSHHINKLTAHRDSIPSDGLYVSYVLGTHSAAERSDRFDKFEKSDIGALSNVRVIAEGVDIPLIDSVYFVDPRESIIDLVQAIGRALRKPFRSENNKVAQVIVPIQVPPGAISLEDINWDETLLTFHNVIQALRSQDDRLEEEINQINLYHATRGNRGYRVNEGKHVRILTPGFTAGLEINVEKFLEAINFRIATANANPDGTNVGFTFLGPGERKSEYKGQFKILGDYNRGRFKESLVDPTMARFPIIDGQASKAAITTNHNNVSHTQRLGLIKEAGNGLVYLTPLGRMYKRGEITFDELFKNQMMLYSTKSGLYPYRAALQTLLDVDEINHIEFVYSLYIYDIDKEQSNAVQGAIRRTQYIKRHYPRIEATSVPNRDRVRETLNGYFGVNISDKDLWGDRSTPKNKFRYLKNALALLDSSNENSSYTSPLRLSARNKENIKHVLGISNPQNAPSKDYYGDWIWSK